MLLFSLAGCLPPQADFEIGLGTSRISGFMVPPPEGPQGAEALVVVFRKHHQFITYADGSAVLRQTARVYPVGKAGEYSVVMPADVVAVELVFIAPDRLSQRFQFQRQLGIGDVTYRADMIPMKNWRSHYYTFLVPQLENLIVEERYRLPPESVELLSRWLQYQNSRLAPPSKNTASPSSGQDSR